ncbi:type I-E CRISPR-associated protein Cas7/Cse4/CasC [Methylobacterium terrae]|uniref:Type I-E CRISPR-associated protein Cas7/Cse4/CasC n=1 Tax=Methylobacterium terrae TaxID=2202827 RepID=A0A2U8WN96_9HYPH|nr:type I-E CRISPR-associated protein Cas7/Cse4/CasC [Methylobacterium terrae]AWN47557.1 type I-E CRISPR-associated protein Cas7/Cse4/CasC [Methylobacterium terrae]
MTRFLQIHSLASYPAVLLNRDDAGLAKRLPYGGSVRTRVSSQSLKRHWRLAEDAWALSKVGAPMGVRSREIVERRVLDKITAAPAIVEAVGAALVKHLYGKNSAKIADRQALLLGEPEIAYLARIGAEAAAAATDAKSAEAEIDARLAKGTGKANLAAMLASAGTLAAGLEAALFGRMVTSDPDANTDAAIHVAHAFTVHAQESESDYFTVVDDLRVAAGEVGSGGIFDTELTSGLYYGYVVVDVPLLVSNLAGDPDLAAKVVEHLVHLIATVSPGAKKGSTAPYAYADLMLVEAGSRQPRTLAGAFRKAVPLRRDGDLAAEAVAAMAACLTRLDRAYGQEEERANLSVVESSDLSLGASGFGGQMTLDGLAAWAAEQVRAGQASAGKGK